MIPHKLRRRIKTASNEEIKDFLLENQGHDIVAHNGKALTQTGFVKNCARCLALKFYDAMKSGNEL